MNIVIRPGVDPDMPALGRLGALLISLHHDFDPPRFFATSPRTAEAYAAFLGQQAKDDQAIVLVAETADTIVGYAYGALQGADYMALRGPAGLLHDLIVDPAHRHEGVGVRLLSAMIDEFTSRGAPRLVLSTAARNEAAQQLFAKAGFRRTMIEMTRELPPSS
jgi:ribosomal protein S18 acetylase RimI-like enzyme